MSNLKRTTIYLTPDIHSWLIQMAKSERRSMSSMCESLLDWNRRNLPTTINPVQLPTITTKKSHNG